MDTPITDCDRAGGAVARPVRGEAAQQDCVRQAVLENADLWFTVTDPDGAVLLWNRAAERISGYASDEVLGSADVWARLFPDERYRRMVFDRCLGTADREAEVAIRCRGGRPKVVLWQLATPHGGGCIALGRELTDRARTVEVLEHPEAFFERFLSSLGVGVFRLSFRSPGRSKTANPVLAAMLGFESTQALLQADHDRILPPSVRSAIAEQLTRLGAMRDFELQLVRRNGTLLDVSVSAQAEFDEEGRLAVVTGTVEDIHSRKAARQALEASEEKYRRLVEGVGEPIITVDEEGMCLAMNRAAARGIGGAPEDFEGRSLWDFLSVETANALMALAHEVIDTGQSHSCELQAALGGKAVWLQTRVYPLHVAGDQGARTQILALDITAKKLGEQEVLRYQQRLRALAARLSDAEERERRRLAADLHDGVSQSLALAIMKLGVLEGAVADSREGAALGEVRDLAEQALHAARTLTSELSPPLLAEFGFDDALEWLAERITERYELPIRVERAGPVPRLPGQVQTVLFRAVRELLVNAGRHAGASEAVVTIGTEDDSVVVGVRDDGRGMDHRVDAAQVGKGGGFGLFNIREQLGQLGGRMQVRPPPERGTCVLLTVPVDAGEADAEGEGA